MFLNKRPTIICLAKKEKKRQLKVDKLQHSTSVHVLLVNIFPKLLHLQKNKSIFLYNFFETFHDKLFILAT